MSEVVNLDESRRRLDWMLRKNELTNRLGEKRFDSSVEKSFYEYLATNRYPEEAIEHIKKLKSWQLPCSLMLTAHMLLEGTEPPQEVLPHFEREIARLAGIKLDEPKEKPVKEVRYTTLEFLEQLDDVKFESGVPNFQVVFDRFNPTAAEVEKIKGIFQGRLEEMRMAVGQVDEQIVEAYGHLTVKEQREAIKWYEALIDFMNGTKAPRKERAPRKTRPKTPGKLVSKLLYLKEDKDLGLTSVDPASIIGAKAVVCFNVKTRMLTYFIAKGDKLSVHRSSIEGFDETESFKKKLRKPKEQLAHVLGGTRLFFEREAAAIRSKASPTVGRINRDTLVLRVFGK